MGRGLAPPPPALAPLEDVSTRQMPKTMPSSPSQGEAKRLKRPGARYFPAEETTLVYPSRPAVPKPIVERPLNGSMKGFGWRVTEDRIRPSADLADKVYFAPVVPGLPQRKRPRRPRILEPLAPSMASVAQLRNKVMGALDSALRSERVPQDMRYRLLGTVEQVMDSEMDVPELEELPMPPRTQAIQMVQDKVKIKLAPTVEPVEAAVQRPARSQEAEAAASTRPPSSVVQAPLDDLESAEVPDAIDEDEVVLVDVCEEDDQLLNLVADEVMDNVSRHYQPSMSLLWSEEKTSERCNASALAVL